MVEGTPKPGVALEEQAATRLTDVRTAGCTIGFHISSTARPVLTGCCAVDSTTHGVLLSGSTAPALDNVEARGSGGNGIVAIERARGTLSDCLVENSSPPGSWYAAPPNPPSSAPWSPVATPRASSSTPTVRPASTG